MTLTRVWTVLRLITLAAFGTHGTPAQASYIVTLEQQGSTVVASGSGTLDLSGMIFVGGGFNIAVIEPIGGFIVTGPTSLAPIDEYGTLAFTGPESFGSGFKTLANSGNGDIVGLDGVGGDIRVPHGYVSGSALSDIAAYNNQTFSSLGVTPGTYEWTWGAGANQNFTLQVGAISVPEPASLAIFGTALAGLGLMRRRRREV